MLTHSRQLLTLHEHKLAGVCIRQQRHSIRQHTSAYELLTLHEHMHTTMCVVILILGHMCFDTHFTHTSTHVYLVLMLLHVSAYCTHTSTYVYHTSTYVYHTSTYVYSCYCMCGHTVESSDSTQLVTLDTTSLVSIFSVRGDIHQAKTGILSDSGICCASADVC